MQPQITAGKSLADKMKGNTGENFRYPHMDLGGKTQVI